METVIAQQESASDAGKTEDASPRLVEMQAAFQRAIMTGDEAVLSELLDNSRTGRHVLFGVYRHAYVARLIEVVRNDHPLLNRYLGGEEFNEVARAYAAACPSHDQNARWFARRLPEFLGEIRSGEPHLAELAALERALNDAFDAADASPLLLSDLATVPPEAWAELVFFPHPSARHLTFTRNAHALWLALRNDTPPPTVEDLETSEDLIAWRQDLMPKVRRMSAEEAMMWNEAARGVPFGSLCQLIAVYDDPATAPARAARHLQQWISSGLLAKATLQD